MSRSRVLGISCVIGATMTAVVLAQPANTPPVRHLRVNGVDLEFVDQGRGTPVVFVHGAVGDLRFWNPQRAAFAKRYRFVAYTYRYHGTAAWQDDGKQYSAEMHAADLAAFIKALKTGPVHLVGLSYGGLLAAMTALKEPHAVRTLTLAEPALFSLLAETPEGLQQLERWNKEAEPMIAAIKAGDNAGAVRQLSALVRGESPGHFDAMPAALREMLLDNARTLPLLLAAPPPTVTCDMMRTIKVPTLVVRGERTPEVFARITGEAGRCTPGSGPVVIPKATHPMSYDNPDEFNRRVLEFLAAASARQPQER